MRGIGAVLPAAVAALVAALAPSVAAAQPRKDPAMLAFVERCGPMASGPDGSWLDAMDWPALCELGYTALQTGDGARAFDAHPTWSAPTRTFVDGLWSSGRGRSDGDEAIAAVARDRQDKALAAGITAITALLEPHAGSPAADDVATTCLDLHLYARILDDAVDEGHPLHRDQALSAQRLVWRAATDLAALAPGRRAAVERIIAETVDANHPYAPGEVVPYWGMRNHHLLVGPLVLAPSVDAFDEVRQPLSWGLWALQASAELREPLADADRAAMRRFLTEHDHAAAMRALIDGGWDRLAEVYLLGVLQAISVAR